MQVKVAAEVNTTLDEAAGGDQIFSVNVISNLGWATGHEEPNIHALIKV